MSDYSSDGFYGLDLSEFTVDDFAHIDANIASLSRTGSYEKAETVETSVGSEPTKNTSPSGLNDRKDTASDTDNECIHDLVNADSSFRSDTFDLNLSTLTTEQFAMLDNQTLKQTKIPTGGPSVPIEYEDSVDEPDASKNSIPVNNHTAHVEKPWLPNSPLDQFRSFMTLSVTDLVAPAWCEVQYEYGLQGKRSRPISERPKSFLSSTGKTIFPEISTVKKNDIQTRHGLAVHKELEREIKYEELQVEITTDETRWALRIVNMLACLKSIIGGFTREMPVFGVVHDEVVVGIMDEVVKEEVPYHRDENSTSSKRPSSKSQSHSRAKRARTNSPSPSPQTRIDAFFETPKKAANKVQSRCDEEQESQPPRSSGYILHIKDNKTRKNPYIPSDPDMQSGRLQLMLYRRLLSQLVSTNPPYDFSSIWRKVDVDSTAIFPTKFLVQAHLIEGSSGFKSTCLDDLVALWHSKVKELNILGVDPTLELVYRLRPPPGGEPKGKDIGTLKRSQTVSNEERELALAIAVSLEDMSTSKNQDDATHSGPSNSDLHSAQDKDRERSTCPVLESEDMELQWALHESTTSQNLPSLSNIPGPSAPEDVVHTATSGKGKEKEKETGVTPKEEGIRRFKIIGTKKFLHNDKELDKYLDHVLEWWRGERKPEGVPLERTYRCLHCEYANDCEWRAEKALEFSKKKRPLAQ